ncbi:MULTISPECIES: aldehyde dehydrogenase family protein [Bacillaceae]|uniref:aldehyde dehydrogenase family protein n=1 Tax=Bacillaceae TaxID=186817 RepID=UPI001CD61A62|nr:aldehyde dehydrogenase family protein [Bacillus infantis]MCA1035291.1 aldehyde dehydrogenase family protein [Bacillus infantis]MDW2877948.1 aldehyde dehydrogenase family protein [Bacillus infantis]
MVNFKDYTKQYINGKWLEGSGANTIDVLNPYDDSRLYTVKTVNEADIDQAMLTAEKAQKKWAKTTPGERKEVLRKVIAYLEEHKEEIIDIYTSETGGTILAANIALQITFEELEEAIKFADEVNVVNQVPATIEGKENHVYRVPVGVITSISPFNFPLNLSVRTIAPAIALGNAVVHKPDVATGITGGVILTKAFEEAGLPAGVLNLLLTDPKTDGTGDYLLEHPIPRFISFTGSTAVGRHVGEIAGRNLKKVALELGGNNPFIVLSDADVDRAVDAAIFGKFVHQGQICMITNRIIVHKDIAEEFTNKFVDRAKALPYGNPKDPATVVGPLINDRQLQKAQAVIEAAIANGEKIALEGQRVGNILTPYVFKDVKNDSALAQTEVFSPIATIIPVESDEEAIRIASETEYGLSSSIFTQDLEKAQQYALQIDSGVTHINDQTVNAQPDIPFGGNKASGVGRFGNPWLIEEFTTTKWVSVQKTYREFPF